MKKILIMLMLLISFRLPAQWFEASATGGGAYYKISGGIRNGACGIFNAGLAITKLKIFDFGVQFTATSKLTMCTSMSPGIFADIVITPDNDQNIFTIGGHGNYVTYGKVAIPGSYYKNGGVDTIATKIDNSLSYGIRLGYKRKFAEHIYGYALVNVTYTETSTIHYGTTGTNTCAVLTIPVMVGIAARF